MSDYHYVNYEDCMQISSPESTEQLLFDYLRPHFEKTSQQQEEKIEEPLLLDDTFFQGEEKVSSLFAVNDAFMSPEDIDVTNITLQISSFSDLQDVICDIDELEHFPSSFMNSKLNSRNQKNRLSITEEDLVGPSGIEPSIPPSVRLNAESSQLVDMLMARAVQHWCCVGFKVAPISVELIKDWRKAPLPIIYCIASISLVTFMDEQFHDSKMCFKQVAMVFYEQARHKLDDILFDDMQPLIIQSYFCLSYTSNLLRLYEQQRTWGGLASISLQHLAESKVNNAEPLDELTLGCWFRWYYVDAWMCLTLNRDCLLPDKIPWIDMDAVAQRSLTKLNSSQHNPYCYGYLTYYMRRYIRALHSRKIFAGQQNLPSAYYYQVTEELTSWYARLPKYDTIAELHFNQCYNSMRQIVLYQFLSPQQSPPHDIVIDCLQTNLQLLQALEHLKTQGCDQSTYHHMFFAIHNTAKRILQYNFQQFAAYAKEQLVINLTLLKGTRAYANDVFKMKMYAQSIQDQFVKMHIVTHGNGELVFKLNSGAWKGMHASSSSSLSSSSTLWPTFKVPRQKQTDTPGYFVFKNELQRERQNVNKKRVIIPTSKSQ